MRYYHEFEVAAPVDQVVAFHAKATTMAAITPPPIIVRFQKAPQHMANGKTMEFTLWLGPLPIHWSAQIQWNGKYEFVDRLISGPFAAWSHRHRFIALNATRTNVIDEINATYGERLWQQLAGRAMWIGLPLLFTYRAWRTKLLLARHSVQHDAKPS